MEKGAVTLVLFYASVTMTMVNGALEARGEVDQWLHKLTKTPKRVTHLRFYVHVMSTGPNTTEVTVAKAPQSNKSPTGFGIVNVIDDLLTEGSEPTSNPVGRFQGIASFSGEDELSFLLIINLVFTTGKFNGSSLTMLGRDPPVLPLREMPIVGGTGLFRLACGFASTRTYHFNATTSNGVYEYNVVVIHF